MVSWELLLKLFFKILCKAHYYRERIHSKKAFGKRWMTSCFLSCRPERVPEHMCGHVCMCVLLWASFFAQFKWH